MYVIVIVRSNTCVNNFLTTEQPKSYQTHISHCQFVINSCLVRTTEAVIVLNVHISPLYKIQRFDISNNQMMKARTICALLRGLRRIVIVTDAECLKLVPTIPRTRPKRKAGRKLNLTRMKTLFSSKHIDFVGSI